MPEPTRRHSNATNLSDEGWTAPATVLLGTPLLVKTGLEYFGIEWDPAAPGSSEVVDGPGLYAWVIAPPGPDSAALLRSPAIYWGKGTSVRGVAERVANETRWVAARPLIGHGLAMARTGARPVVGHVRVCQDTHAWESVMTPDVPVDAVAVAAPKLEAFAAGLRDPERMLTLVERFAIRAALCAGDVPAPVNSQYASAWELREGDTELADLAAWYVVRHMAGGIRGWL